MNAFKYALVKDNKVLSIHRTVLDCILDGYRKDLIVLPNHEDEVEPDWGWAKTLFKTKCGVSSIETEDKSR